MGMRFRKKFFDSAGVANTTPQSARVAAVESVKTMGTILKEFKQFALRGSVIDLAVGIIVGAAFNKIVSSLVNDVVMPPIGYILGKVDFSNLYLNLSQTPYKSLSQAQQAGAPTINYGLFVNAMISFIITAFVIFLIVRLINQLRSLEKKKEDKQEANTTKICPFCKSSVAFDATRCPYCTSELKN
jgi:large conductance mechanosensitive channel